MTKCIRNKFRDLNLSARLARFLAIVSVAASAAGTRADVQMFLKLVAPTGLGELAAVGDSPDPTYRGSDGWFAVKGFDIKVENAATIGATSGLGSGKAKLVEFSLAKDIDPRTPTIFKGLASGGHWQYVRLAVRRPGITTGPAYLTYDFYLVFASNQEWVGAAAESVLSENVKFAYGALKVSVTPPPPTTGPTARPVISSWDQIKNNDDFIDPAD